MIKQSKKVLTAIVACLLFCTNVQAGFILNGSLDVDTLSLPEDPTDFYDYRFGSSNTGLEMDESIVLFLTSFNAKTYLFGLFDSRTSQTRGKLDLIFDENSTTDGMFTLVDEQNEFDDSIVNGNTRSFIFRWGNNYSDGFVYELGGDLGTDITLNFGGFVGLDSYTFLTFDELGDSSALLTERGVSEFSLNITHKVSEPSIFLFFSMALVGFCLSSRRAR